MTRPWLSNWNKVFFIRLIFILLIIKAIVFLTNSVFLTNANKNRDHKCTKSQFAIDSKLVPFYNSFIKDASDHGIKKDHIFCINKITWGTSYDCQGVTSFDNNTIHINEWLSEDTVGTRLVFYHELGHWFGLGHSEGIMAKSYNSERDSAYVRENWNELVNNYFIKLKDAQRN